MYSVYFRVKKFECAPNMANESSDAVLEPILMPWNNEEMPSDVSF